MAKALVSAMTRDNLVRPEPGKQDQSADWTCPQLIGEPCPFWVEEVTKCGRPGKCLYEAAKGLV